MPEIISCPSCQRKLQAPESIFGQDVQCPTCGATFVATFGAPPVRTMPAPRESNRPRPESGRSRPVDDYGLDDDTGNREDRRPVPRREQVPHRGAAVLTLGILALVGLVICIPSLVLGPIAWTLGTTDLALIRAGRMDRTGEGMTSAGQICGIIATILAGIGVFLFCLGKINNQGPFDRPW